MSRISRRAALSLAAGAVATPVAGTVTVAATQEERSGRNRVVRADLITAVMPSDNWRVIAVAIRYAHRIDLRGGQIPSSAFQVAATINRETASRTVTRAYTNTAAEVSDRGRPGEYLIIELDPRDANARAAGADPLPLDRAYAIRQVTDLPELPASPFAIRNDGMINPVVDDFCAGSFTDSTGFEIDFRLYEPTGPGRYPLVITLHGGGEVADNNMTQLTGNRIAVTFAKPDRQRRHPAFVLAPQVPLPRPMEGPDGTDWTDARVQAATVGLIDTFIAKYPVDTDRIYLVGLSSGGRGILNLLPKHPGKFAAAIPTAGWGDPSTIDKITHIPLWADHSIDDQVVPYKEGRFGKPGTWTLMNALEAAGAKVTRGEWANNLPEAEFEARSRALLREARAKGSHVLFTSYSPGTTPVNPHLAWAQTYENDVVIDWLFAQSRR
ncbi:putative peptidase [Kibdelosporangium banguiense]|uniref:Peptidase n=1 Tax=Kibdelosporangium banguiense TaxID=1365924 RepID=A0ABS4TNL5_9PSEU|nr:prolyl oligopeptidase family serine peptidase [Kibdelosporangium banguiense]MBP2325996.1 putative peptidase [Kibdelosporangium banguiense]